MNMEAVAARDLAEALKITKQAVVKRAQKEGWANKTGPNRTRLYNIDQLPADVKTALVEAQPELTQSLIATLPPEAALVAAKKMVPTDLYKGIASSAPNTWTADNAIGMDVLRDPKVGRWVRIIQEAQDVPKGWKKRPWIEAVAAKHGVSWQTIYRKIAAYEKQGLAGLKHTKGNRGKPRVWTPEAVDWWVGLVLKQDHRKIAKDSLYSILTIEARKRGWQIGGYESALWWLDKRATPQLLALQRGGMRALDNMLPPILRDYSDLAPFEILVGDQHRWDFWVVDEESGEVFRPEGYYWQDLRTRCLYGGALDKKYDSYLIGLALRVGIKAFGAFDSIYTDNGKPELSRYVMSIMKDMRTLGLRVEGETDVPVDLSDVEAEEVNPCVVMPGTHRKAIVRNAKAKMIEGTFNVLEGIMRDHMHVPGYVKKLGGNPEENEVDQKEIERLATSGKLLGFWEFAQKLYQAMDYYNSSKSHRGVLKEWAWRPKPKSATPIDCLKSCYVDGWRPARLSDEAIDLVFLPRAPRGRVVDRGRVLFRNEQYEHEALIELHGQRVDVRFDPLDPEWVLIFHEEAFICRAEIAELSSMKDTELAKRKIEEKRRRRKGFMNEYSRLTSNIPDFREFSQIPEAEKVAAQVGKAKRQAAAKQLEQSEAGRVRTQEELNAEVANLEKITSPKKQAKKLPARPTYFLTDYDHYKWIVKYVCAGGELEAADRAFKEGYESQLDDEQREYWETVKSVGGGV